MVMLFRSSTIAFFAAISILCGEPEAKQGNTWIYKQGSMRRMLTFWGDGKLQLIESVRS